MLHTGSCWLVNIYGWRNTATGKLQQFDGYSHGVINASDAELFTFEFLYHFVRGILDHSQSFRGYLISAVDAWLKGSESCLTTPPRKTDQELFERVQEYAVRVDNESLSRRLQKLFIESVVDFISLQFQHGDFDAKADFTCHCHKDCTTPLMIFILYDNGCNSLRYALNRNPETTKEMIWLVDKLHWAGHTTCSPFLDSGAWPFVQGGRVNTQVAEQKNRVTKFLQRSSAYLSWGRQLTIQHYLFRWVNQYQELKNMSLHIPTNSPARIIVTDGVTVSMRLSQCCAARPYITSKNVRARVEPSDRLMIGVKGHRDALDAIISDHYTLAPLKEKSADALRAFLLFMDSSRPALRWLIKFTVRPSYL